MKIADFKAGKTYVCVKSGRPWWTKGKEYEVLLNKYGELCFVDDDGAAWSIEYLTGKACYHVELKETQSNAETEKHKYTGFDVTKVILRAYNMYDNDAQRLAYIKGYFAK